MLNLLWELPSFQTENYPSLSQLQLTTVRYFLHHPSNIAKGHPQAVRLFLHCLLYLFYLHIFYPNFLFVTLLYSTGIILPCQHRENGNVLPILGVSPTYVPWWHFFSGAVCCTCLHCMSIFLLLKINNKHWNSKKMWGNIRRKKHSDQFC